MMLMMMNCQACLDSLVLLGTAGQYWIRSQIDVKDQLLYNTGQ